jgi:hypothetical protein
MMKAFGQRNSLILIVAATTLALMVGGCGTSSHGPDDHQIISSIDAKLGQDPDLRTLSVNVTSKQGVVTLSGMVNAPVEKLAVEDVARKTAGVKQVDDNLTVASVAGETGAPAPSSEQAAANPPQARHHHARRSVADSAAGNQPPPDSQEAQNAPQAPPDQSAQAQDNPQAAPDNSAQTQANPQPAPDGSAQAQSNSQPAGSDTSPSAPASASAHVPPSAPAAAAAPAPQNAPTPPSPAVPPQQVTIPAGTVVRVRMIDGVSSGTAQPGQIYKASLSEPVSIDNQVVVPRDATARVRVVEAQSAGHYQGQPLLKLELVSFKINGAKYSAKSDYYTKVGPSRGKNTAEKVGGGAALGALLGGLLGHGRGAGIGAVVGAGAGTVDQSATHAQEVRIPSETKIEFTLKKPVSVTVSGGH